MITSGHEYECKALTDAMSASMESALVFIYGVRLQTRAFVQ